MCPSPLPSGFLDAASRAPTPPTCLSARHRAKCTLRRRLRCVRAVRSSGLLCLVERRRRRRPRLFTSSKPKAAHLIAIVNGRTYIRYALGLCTGLSRDASSSWSEPPVIVVLVYRLAKSGWLALLSTSIASSPEGEEQQFGRPARAHARTQSGSGVAVDMPQRAAPCDRRRGGVGWIRGREPRSAPG